MLKKLLLIPPILIGLAALYYMVNSREAPERKPASENARVVRVIPAQPVDLVPRVTGFGSVYPSTVWNGIAQVAGEVSYVNPALKKGAILPAGTEIVRISPVDYQLALRQAEANIRSAEAKLAELKVSETNTADLLEIETRSLQLREDQLTRMQDLFKRGTVSQSALESEQRDTLAQRKKVQDLINTLRLLPTQRAVQQEQIAVYRAQVQAATLDLKRTRIAMPFTGRIAAVNVESQQFVQTGSNLVTADSLAVAEVEAQIPISQFRAMILAAAGTLPAQGITPESLEHVIGTLGLTAKVTLRAGGDSIQWPARFARISDTVDPKTRTIGAIVAVDGAYAHASPGRRPPLAKGMFVEIEIRAAAQHDRLVVPRSALRNGHLYVVDNENRLEIRSVKTGLMQGDLAAIDEGLKPGEQVVVSDVLPAVAGMLLSPHADDGLWAALQSEASEGKSRQ